MELDTNIDNLRRLLTRERQRNGLSLTDVADRVGVSKSSLWNWEMGVKTPSIIHAVKWAKVFDYDLLVLKKKRVRPDGRPK